MDLLDYIRSVRAAVAISDLPPEQLMLRHEITQVIAEASNADLLLAYQRTDGGADDREVDARLAEIERRGLTCER